MPKVRHMNFRKVPKKMGLKITLNQKARTVKMKRP